MRALALILSLLILLLIPLTANAAADFFVHIVLDDVGTWAIGANRSSSVGDAEPDYMPAVTIATPNIDTIAANGFSHGSIRSASSVCSPDRATKYDFGPTHVTLYGLAKAVDDTITDHAINPYSKHIFNSAEAAGYTTALFGKLHLDHWWVPDGNKRGTLVSALGIDYADVIGIGNLSNTLPGYDYTALTTPSYADCGGSNNYFVLTDATGAVTAYTDYSTDVVVDAAVAYMAAQTTGSHFITIAPFAPHRPWAVPSDPLGCAAATPENSDLPPGSTASTQDELYQDAMEYVDTKIADVVAELSYGTDIICVSSDNGVPDAITLSAEVDQSPGSKKTPYRGGTGVVFTCRGTGIASNKLMGGNPASLLNSAEDIAPTLLDLMGGWSPNGYGISFADCMTESNGQTAASCRHTRDTNLWWRWDPIGGVAGTRATLPDPANDDCDEWTVLEVSVETYLDGEPMLLHRVYDPTSCSAMDFYELLWSIDATQNGRYIVAAGTKLAETAATDGGLIEAGDWDSGPNATETANLALLHKTIADTLARGGIPTASFGGASF